MKQLYLLLSILMTSTLYINAQSYTITFSAEGAAATIDEVIVTNLRTDETVILGAGDQLILNSTTTAINAIAEQCPFRIASNTGEYIRVHYTCLKNEAVELKVTSLSGRTICVKEYLIAAGNHEFVVDAPMQGMYLVSLTNAWHTHCVKHIQNSAGLGQIVYNGKHEISAVSLKAQRADYELSFTSGDIISYKVVSGNYTTIINEPASASKTIIAQMVECVDADGQYYPTVQIGNQTWMAKNLAYLPSISTEFDMEVIAPRYYVQEYTGNNISQAKQTSNYQTYGVLYNWAAAKASVPTGWHLPTYDEWLELINYCGGMEVAGPILMSTKANNDPDCSGVAPANLYGFSGLPGGSAGAEPGITIPDDFWAGIHVEFCWWSATEFDQDNAYNFYMYCGDTSVDLYEDLKEFVQSVRCVKD